MIQHPGERLKRLASKRAMTQSQLADALGVGRSYVCDMMHGRRGFGAKMALALEGVFTKPSAEQWMTMQAHYDLALLRGTEHKRV